MQQVLILQLTTVEKVIMVSLIVAIVLILRTIFLEYKEVREIEDRIAADQEIVAKQKEQISVLQP